MSAKSRGITSLRGLALALLAAMAVVPASGAHAGESRHTFAVTARVIESCLLDGAPTATRTSTGTKVDARVTCSRNAVRPSIVVSPAPGTAPIEAARRTADPAIDSAGASRRILVTVFY